MEHNLQSDRCVCVEKQLANAFSCIIIFEGLSQLEYFTGLSIQILRQTHNAQSSDPEVCLGTGVAGDGRTVLFLGRCHPFPEIQQLLNLIK